MKSGTFDERGESAFDFHDSEDIRKLKEEI